MLSTVRRYLTRLHFAVIIRFKQEGKWAKTGASSRYQFQRISHGVQTWILSVCVIMAWVLVFLARLIKSEGSYLIVYMFTKAWGDGHWCFTWRVIQLATTASQQHMSENKTIGAFTLFPLRLSYSSTLSSTTRINPNKNNVIRNLTLDAMTDTEHLASKHIWEQSISPLSNIRNQKQSSIESLIVKIHASFMLHLKRLLAMSQSPRYVLK